MKKVYALMGLALAMGLTSVAAPRATKAIETMSQEDFSTVAIQPKKTVVAGPAKEVTEINDLAGIYKLTLNGHLNSAEKSGYRSEIVRITVLDATSINIGFSIADCKASVNIKKQTITITNKTPAREINGEMTYWYTYNLECNEEGKITKKTAASRIQGFINEDGSIEFPENCGLGITSEASEPEGSYYYLDNELFFEPVPMNTPDLADYDDCGEATFDDGWFNSLCIISNVTPVPPVQVACLKHNSEPKYVLVNPYGADAWVEKGLRYEGSNGEGYILIDATYPDMIQIVPLVPSGMVMNDADEGQEPELTEWYCCNNEGMAGYNGEDLETLAEQWADVGRDASTLEGNTISLYNLFFSPDYAPGAQYWWSKWPETEPRTGSIVLPTGGINGVSSDNVAATRYYTIDGVQIAKPAKGQMVIVKKGNETKKYIAR